MDHEYYMRRCLDLAALGAGTVAPNPMVGAVLVWQDIIIGEGYHRQYGEAHAEVNCISNVKAADRGKIKEATLYVSLEPCSHYGKTPPCTELIIRNKIPQVVIGVQDIYREVSGNGIKKLQDAGVKVITGVLEEECRNLNRRFFTFHTHKRPYIILKWAQSLNAKTGGEAGKRIFISNEFTNRLVHKWRSEEAGILVGFRTALQDDPALTTRLWPGKNPLRIVMDKQLQLPGSLRLFNEEAGTIVYNCKKEDKDRDHLLYKKLAPENFLEEMLLSLCEQHVLSVIVEGGARTLQQFIDKKLWDEARVITNTELFIEKGMDAPVLRDAAILRWEEYGSDVITYYRPAGA